jgi:hypothetical protein
MRVLNPQSRFLCRRACLAGVVGLLALTGCKSRDGNGGNVGGNSQGKIRDPLVYGPTRIPPQNVPLPDRANGKSDPLTSPVSKPTGTGVGYSDNSERFRGTFIPGQGTTPAALAAKPRDGEELKIADVPDNRVPLRQAGGVLPDGEVGRAGGTGAAPESAPAGVESLFTELGKYGVTRSDRSLGQENGEWVFRAAVPISGNGARRQYTAVGKTAPEAVKQVLDQVVADRK